MLELYCLCLWKISLVTIDNYTRRGKSEWGVRSGWLPLRTLDIGSETVKIVPGIDWVYGWLQNLGNIITNLHGSSRVSFHWTDKRRITKSKTSFSTIISGGSQKYCIDTYLQPFYMRRTLFTLESNNKNDNNNDINNCGTHNYLLVTLEVFLFFTNTKFWYKSYHKPYLIYKLWINNARIVNDDLR